VFSKNGANDNRYYAVNEWELYNQHGGTNLCVGATASASGAYGSQSANLAIDGNPATYWESAIDGAPSWLKVDLGVARVVRSMVIKSTALANEIPRDFTLQGSNDDSTWTVIETYEGADAFIATSGVFALNFGVKGTSLLDDGTPSTKVWVHAWDTGDLLGSAVPEGDGSYRVLSQIAGDVLITHVGPAGYRPVSDGPITPGDI
jgi:hypothetical protein